MPDYSKGKIYTIRCKYDTTLIYVGSTINPLYKRLGSHKVKSKSCPTRKIYSTINNDWENWYIKLYESYPCVNIEELTKREGEIIRLIGNLNTVIIGRTPKEWKQEHKEHVKQRGKKYYDTNKERNSEVCKQYQRDNAEQIKEKRKEYRENNTGKIKERKSEKIPCDKCGEIGTKAHMSRHQKTQKCMNFTPE